MASSEDNDESLKCSICLEVFCKPIKITCGHTFCEDCLAPCLEVTSPNCPLCRKVFDPKKRVKDKNVEKRMSTAKSVCPGCSKRLSMSKIRIHIASCPKAGPLTDSAARFKPVAATSQQTPSDTPNRDTFKCPYCGVKNLDSSGLGRHCNNEHRDNTSSVVCPICASMPWGDPNYHSSSFIDHLNLRHKFEYGTYVDYREEEDAVLQKVLESSLQDN